MNRREAISMVAWLTGGLMVGAEVLLTGCSNEYGNNVTGLFRPEMTNLLGDIADVILPPTGSPGAKEAGVGECIPVIIRDCYTEENQQIMVAGLREFQTGCKTRFNEPFEALTNDQKLAYIIQLDKSSKEYHRLKEANMPDHYFFLLKQLVLFSYFTSEKGATKALRYVQIPGKYIGDYPYKKGDKAWAI